MRRRKFLLTSGSTILTGTAISSLQRPSVGIEFSLSAIPDKKPSNTDSILVEFTKVKITPQYLDENKEIDITVTLDIEDEKNITKRASNITFSNGETINKTKIKNRTNTDTSSITIDELQQSKNTLSGSIRITVNHPDISTQEYKQNFEINSASIPSSTLPEDLVAWYRFEDGDARDYTATINESFADTTAYDGTISGATFQSTGGVTDFENGGNSGISQFNENNNEHIYVTEDIGIFSGSFTVMLYVKPNAISSNTAGSDRRAVLGYNNPNDTFNKWFAYELYDDGISLTFDDDTEKHDPNFDIAENQWHHACSTYNAGTNTAKHYIDGNSQTSKDVGQPEYSGNEFTIGDYYRGDGRTYDGDVDDVRIYNRVLSSSEITDIYDQTKP